MTRRWAWACAAAIVACAPRAPTSVAPPAPRSPPPVATVAVAATASAPAALRAPTPDAPFRQHPPALAPMPEFAPPPVRTFRLANGLPVFLLEQHASPRVQVQLVAKPREPIGVETLRIVSSLLRQSTTHRTYAQIGQVLDEQGARYASWTESGALHAAITGPSSGAAALVELLADMAQRPALRPDTVDALRAESVARRRAYGEDARDAAPTVLAVALFGCDAVRAMFPCEDDARALTRDGAAAAYASVLDPANVALVVAGDATEATLRPALEPAFGAWTPAAKAPPKGMHAAEPPRAEPLHGARLVLVDRPHTAGARVLVGGAAPPRASDDWTTAAIVLKALELSAPSPSAAGDHEALRPSSPPRLRVLPNGAAWWWQLDAPNDGVAGALRAVDRALGAIREPGPTPAALDEARRDLLVQDPTWLLTLDDVATRVSTLPLFELPVDDSSRQRDRLRRTTLDDVRRVAAAMLAPSRTKVVIVGDWAALRPQLAAVQGGDVELRDAFGERVRVERAPSR